MNISVSGYQLDVKGLVAREMKLMVDSDTYTLVGWREGGIELTTYQPIIYIHALYIHSSHDFHIIYYSEDSNNSTKYVNYIEKYFYFLKKLLHESIKIEMTFSSHLAFVCNIYFIMSTIEHVYSNTFSGRLQSKIIYVKFIFEILYRLSRLLIYV